MASDSSSSSSGSSSSSSSSSSDDASTGNDRRIEVPTDVDGVNTQDGGYDEEYEPSTVTPDDEYKIYLSRVPQAFNEDSVKRIMHEKFGDGCVVDVSLVSTKEEEDGDAKNESKENEKKEHRGFGFVTFSSKETWDEAINTGTVRGTAKENSKKKHTLYIQQVVRDESNNDSSDSKTMRKDVCFLWKKFRCPYGDDCKFSHLGEGGCAGHQASEEKKSKLQKCFSFKKRGKCKLGDKCTFSHDFGLKNETSRASELGVKTPKDRESSDKSIKDCINWKTKGKCRKGDKCPYRHDEDVRLKALAKRSKSTDTADGLSKTKRKLQERQNKVKQSLSIRVFGLNYSTTKEDVEEFFTHCGKIVEITFPTYEDSGRSKGYCGILFVSPKAVQKAIEMDGAELHGRWLSIQEGKMFLRKWEEDERTRRGGVNEAATKEEPLIGEYGQKVKRRKKHGFSD